MQLTLDPRVAALLGSETRAKVLGFLADVREPKTGYAVAEAIGVKPPKVYKELKRLAGSGLLAAIRGPAGPVRYRLDDEPLRRFLLSRVRVTTFRDWFHPARVEDRAVLLEKARALRVVLPPLRAEPEALPNPSEFRRPPGKDAVLRRLRASLEGSGRSKP